MQTKGSATTPPQGPAHSQLSQKEIVAPPPHATMVPWYHPRWRLTFCLGCGWHWILHWRLFTHRQPETILLNINRNLFTLIFIIWNSVVAVVITTSQFKNKMERADVYSNVYKCKGYVLATGPIMSNAAATKCRLGVCRSVLATVLGISRRCQIP